MFVCSLAGLEQGIETAPRAHLFQLDAKDPLNLLTSWPASDICFLLFEKVAAFSVLILDPSEGNRTNLREILRKVPKNFE